MMLASEGVYANATLDIMTREAALLMALRPSLGDLLAVGVHTPSDAARIIDSLYLSTHGSLFVDMVSHWGAPAVKSAVLATPGDAVALAGSGMYSISQLLAVCGTDHVSSAAVLLQEVRVFRQEQEAWLLTSKIPLVSPLARVPCDELVATGLVGMSLLEVTGHDILRSAYCRDELDRLGVALWVC